MTRLQAELPDMPARERMHTAYVMEQFMGSGGECQPVSQAHEEHWEPVTMAVGTRRAKEEFVEALETAAWLHHRDDEITFRQWVEVRFYDGG